jgi:phosphoglycerate kinase
MFENKLFKNGSESLLKTVMASTTSGATSIIGGGDTVNLVKSVKDSAKSISHVSTGGGASLELLEGKELPGVKYLSDKSDL